MAPVDGKTPIADRFGEEATAALMAVTESADGLTRGEIVANLATVLEEISGAAYRALSKLEQAQRAK